MRARGVEAAWGVAAALSVGVACRAEPDLIYAALPDEGYLAAVYLDEAARLVAASGLARASSPLTLEIDSASGPARRVLLVGYEAPVIDGLTALEPEALASVPLVRAQSANAALPPPSWWAQASLGSEPVELETAPATEPFPIALSAPWVPPCDRSLTQLERPGLRLSCGTEYCDGEVEQNGCELLIRTQRCVPSVITAPVGAAPGRLGSARVEGALQSCEPVSPRPDALFSLDCGGAARCLVDVLPPSLPLRPAVRVLDSGPLLDVPPLGSKPELTERFGYLSGLAHVGDHLLVSSFDGEVGSRRCLETERTRLFVLRDDTLEVVATSTAPSCLTTMVGDPVSGGFLAIHGRPARALVRIDLRGRIVASRALPAELGPGLVALAALFDARPVGRGEAPTLAVTFGRHRERARGYFASFDAVTLAPRHVLTLEPERADRRPDYVSVLLGGEPEEFVVLDRAHRTLWAFFPAFSADAQAFPLGLCAGVSEPVEVIESGPGSVLFRSFDSEDRGSIGVFGLREDSFCQRLGFFEHAAEPTAMIPWPTDARLHLVGLRRTGPEGAARAELAFFDAELPGYSPGFQEIGTGDVGAFVPGRDGAVFTTLPWTARVLRLEPAP